VDDASNVTSSTNEEKPTLCDKVFENDFILAPTYRLYNEVSELPSVPLTVVETLALNIVNGDGEYVPAWLSFKDGSNGFILK
jgi:hypothetical protein